MRSTSRYALVAALGFALTAVAPGAPAFAKKKEEAATPQLKIGDAVRKPLAEADAATKAKNIPAAEAALAQARQAAKTPDEQFVVAQYGLNAAQASGDQAKLSAALDEMITTGEAAGKLPDDQRAKFYWFQGQFAYQAKNYAKAEAALTKAIAAGSTEADAYAVLADVQNRNGKPAEALTTLQKIIQTKAAAGQPVPTDWYGRGADIASRAKLPGEFVKITTSWLTAYPVKQNWHDSLFIYRQMAGLSGENDLDLLRLARAVDALPLSAQSNYVDYALAVYLRFPNEAVDVLNEGIKAGKLNPATSQNTREIIALSQPKLGPDKASIPAAVTAANGPKATFKSAMTTADLLYGYKDFAKAADIYKIALTKPGADAAQANYRLGLALAQAGDKEGAKAAFDAAGTAGNYGILSQYAKVWVDHPAAS
ncbi:tetratricopeptide repeat protein [Rhizorhabdus sp. FW153]|uniref:tetratricopeptide repeat protein n=1 Tax=Rhizorhabdus sp. FW153 TaxID=3400216 RepID=UPI003CF721C3